MSIPPVPPPVGGPPGPITPPPPAAPSGGPPAPLAQDGITNFEPDFIQLRSTRPIDLPPGQLSLIEFARVVTEVINQLREILRQSELTDAGLTSGFFLSSLASANGIVAQYEDMEARVDIWNGQLTTQRNAINTSFNNLNSSRTSTHVQILNVFIMDRNNIQNVNTYINIYNNPASFTAFANAPPYNGDETAALNFINSQISSYNSYLASRPNVQAALTNYINQVNQYNNLISNTNTTLNSINASRAEFNLPPLDLATPTPVPLGSITAYLGGYAASLAPKPLVSLPAGSTSITAVSPVPGPGPASTLPPPTGSGEIPSVSISEAINLGVIPDILSFLAFFGSFNDILRLAQALADEEVEYYRQQGIEITLPAAFLQRTDNVFLEALSSAGGGAGPASLSIGLFARNLEILLSDNLFRASATNSQIPISDRLFARLQFTALELLQKSSLLSSVPAIRFIASEIGHLGASSPAVNVAISLAITEQVVGLVAAGVVRDIVNAEINRLPLFARVSGDTRLQNTLGALSVGGLASFTQAVASTLSLSILTVALAQLGRSIGLPSLVPQLFANLSGVPTIAILTALSAGSQIGDVLDNPVSIMALKQTLLDVLVFQRGFNSVSAGIQINSAINAILLRGGINNFSQLQSELVREFQLAGFSLFQANLLANETTALIRGDVGINFLNAAFGLNVDRSTVASSVADNIQGIDAGIAGSILSGAIERSLLLGGFGSSVRLQNELADQFEGLGLNRNDAEALASQVAAFIATAGLVVPLTQFPGLSGVLLGDPFLRAVASGSSIDRNELINDLQARGLSDSQAQFLAGQVEALIGGSFQTPETLLAIALEAAIGRTGTSYETQREFRDSLVSELRGVGFSRNDALFLANSIAAFALNGALTSPFGVTEDRLAAIEGSTVSRLSEDLGIPRDQAQEIYNEARADAQARGPFSSESELRNVLREEIARGVLAHTGSGEGNVIFDRAIAQLSDPGTILSLASLVEQVSTSTQSILRPDVSARAAEEIRDQVLNSVFGGTTIDEIENEEQRNPLSTLNQIQDRLNDVLRSEEEEDTRRTLRRLIQLLQTLLTPNAQIGFLLQSLSDSPSTFIGSVLGSQQPVGEFLDIQV